MAEFEDIRKLLDETLATNLAADDHGNPPAILLEADQLLMVCRILFEHPQLYFDSLSCITGLDNGPEKGTMEVIYNFYSIPFHHALGVKVTVARENPVVPSLATLWKAADWQERETFDLLGIRFSDHPDLRRILLPADWEGFPLRKDYQHQAYYRGIKVEWSEEQ